MAKKRKTASKTTRKPASKPARKTASRPKKAAASRKVASRPARRRSGDEQPDPLNIAMGLAILLLVGLLVYFYQLPA
jgi:hypothetical protein